MARIKHYNASINDWEYSDISSAVKGETGATPNLTIGTVTTLATGANATATITGTAENPVLNLGLPRGEAVSGGGGIGKAFQIAASTSSGLDTNLFLLDTADNNILKYHNGTSWAPVTIGWG